MLLLTILQSVLIFIYSKGLLSYNNFSPFSLNKILENLELLIKIGQRRLHNCRTPSSPSQSGGFDSRHFHRDRKWWEKNLVTKINNDSFSQIGDRQTCKH
jgi:hypothetical protein